MRRVGVDGKPIAVGGLQELILRVKLRPISFYRLV